MKVLVAYFSETGNTKKLANAIFEVVVEAWMSVNIDLLYKSVGKDKDKKAEIYDPLENLKMNAM